MQHFLELEFWNNTMQDYLIFLGSLVASFIVIFILRHIILHRLMTWAQKTPTSLDDMIIHSIKKYLVPLLYIGALYLNTKWLTLSVSVTEIVNVAALAAVMILAAVVISSVLIYLLNKYFEKNDKTQEKMAMRWIGVIIRIIVWGGALLLFLEMIDVPITTLVAGLGIGGVAIAFAAQAVLEDVFSFVSIFFDKPFELDDFIVVDDLMGTVEHIGIKTTRLRSISGEQLVFANKDLTSSRVRNYKRMEARRIVFTLGVTYDTPTERLKEIPSLIESIFDGMDDARFDRAHFKEFADFSLNFEIVYYVLSQDFALYMDIQQTVNLAIKNVFDQRGIDFAFPTQTLYLEK